jgi:hypothetical protein
MANTRTVEQETSFDLFRITKAKEVVDLCPNTVRKFFKKGLRHYRRGKAIFVSKSELDAFIRSGSNTVPQ